MSLSLEEWVEFQEMEMGSLLDQCFSQFNGSRPAFSPP